METPQQPPAEKKKNSKLIYIIIGIVVLCIGCLVVSAIFGIFVLPDLAPEPTATPLPTNTPIPPTAPPPPTAAPENTPVSSEGTSQEEGGCINWKDITRDMEGEKHCVYGDVYKTYNTNEAWRIDFGSEKNSFFMYDTKYYYNVEIGDCVAAEGTIKSISGVPYLNIEDQKLYFCQ
ncbi:MAG: hypothetical protein GY755_09630 [Chloroflexi bacterium]|nr:hypothetical protein [Chloroflexota bacterium]